MSPNALIHEFADRVRAVLGSAVHQIYWFGSRRRGTASAESDYDILIETGERVTETEREAVADICIDLTAASGAVFDVHYYTTAELQRPPLSFTPFIQAVQEEGLRV